MILDAHDFDLLYIDFLVLSACFLLIKVVFVLSFEEYVCPGDPKGNVKLEKDKPQQVISPGYNTGKYPNGVKCTWAFEVSDCYCNVIATKISTHRLGQSIQG